MTTRSAPVVACDEHPAAMGINRLSRCRRRRLSHHGSARWRRASILRLLAASSSPDAPSYPRPRAGSCRASLSQALVVRLDGLAEACAMPARVTTRAPVAGPPLQRCPDPSLHSSRSRPSTPHLPRPRAARGFGGVSRGRSGPGLDFARCSAARTREWGHLVLPRAHGAGGFGAGTPCSWGSRPR
jgi:hypothetical protein